MHIVSRFSSRQETKCTMRFKCLINSAVSPCFRVNKNGVQGILVGI